MIYPTPIEREDGRDYHAHFLDNLHHHLHNFRRSFTNLKRLHLRIDLDDAGKNDKVQGTRSPDWICAILRAYLYVFVDVKEVRLQLVGGSKEDRKRGCWEGDDAGLPGNVVVVRYDEDEVREEEKMVGEHLRHVDRSGSPVSTYEYKREDMVF